MRMQPHQRRRMITEAAVHLAKNIGLKNLTFENVAEACPVRTSPGTVRRYMGSIHDLWTAAATDTAEAKALGLGDD